MMTVWFFACCTAFSGNLLTCITSGLAAVVQNFDEITENESNHAEIRSLSGDSSY